MNLLLSSLVIFQFLFPLIQSSPHYDKDTDFKYNKQIPHSNFYSSIQLGPIARDNRIKDEFQEGSWDALDNCELTNEKTLKKDIINEDNIEDNIGSLSKISRVLKETLDYAHIFDPNMRENLVKVTNQLVNILENQADQIKNQIEEKMINIFPTSVTEKVSDIKETINRLPETISGGTKVAKEEALDIAQLVFEEIKNVLLEKKSISDAIFQGINRLKEKFKELIVRTISNGLNYIGQDASEKEVRAYLSDKKKRIINAVKEKKNDIVESFENYTIQKKTELFNILTQNKERFIDQAFQIIAFLIRTLKDLIINNLGKLILFTGTMMFFACFWCIGFVYISFYIYKRFSVISLLKGLFKLMKGWITSLRDYWNDVPSKKEDTYSSQKKHKEKAELDRDIVKTRENFKETSHRDNVEEINKPSKDQQLEKRIRNLERLLQDKKERWEHKRFNSKFNERSHKRRTVFSNKKGYPDSTSDEDERFQNYAEDCQGNYAHQREKQKPCFKCTCGKVWTYERLSERKKLPKSTRASTKHLFKHPIYEPKEEKIQFSPYYSSKPKRYPKRYKELYPISPSDSEYY